MILSVTEGLVAGSRPYQTYQALYGLKLIDTSNPTVQYWLDNAATLAQVLTRVFY
jgi:hypothetical protein